MKCSGICLWLGAFVFKSGVFCQTYVGIDVFTPSPTLETYPTSINKPGDIAGYYLDQLTDRAHGFVYTPGGCTSVGCTPFTSFDPLGPGLTEGTFPNSINDAGAITGYYFPVAPPPFNNHGFVRDPEGNFTTFDPPGSISTIANSINAGGAITGYYNESNLVVHGFVREPGGKITAFDPPDSTSTTAVSINANGIITGFYRDVNNRTHGFVRQPSGEIVSFDPPESIGTIVTGINKAGAIAGFFTVSNGRTFGFLRRPGGKFESFDVPGSLQITPLQRSLLTAGFRINDEGAITGSYSDSNGSHGFVRSPEGMITSFDPTFGQTFCSSRPFSGFETFPTSINQKGVIVGWCYYGGVTNFFAGFERFP